QLAGCTDQQIRLRHGRRIQRIANDDFVNILRLQVVSLDALADLLHRIDDLAPSAIVDRQAQSQTSVVRADTGILVDLVQHLSRQSLTAANSSKSNVLLEYLRSFFEQILFQKRH